MMKQFHRLAPRILAVCLIMVFLGVFSTPFLQAGDDSQQAAEFNAKLSAALEKSLKERAESQHIIGASLAVRSPDQALWKGTTGYAVLETKQKMTDNLHFRIGSITKTFTATLVLMLIDEKKLSFDDTVDALVPELKIVTGDRITVKNLLAMRSGLQKYLGDEAFMPFFKNDPGRVWTPEDIVAFSNKSASAPGTTFLYNNGNYVLLGLIIEKVTGMTFKDALEHYILNPLDLSQTAMQHTLNMPLPFAHGYQYGTNINGDPVDLVINATYYINPTTAWSSGAMTSTLDDLASWAKVYFGGELISEALHKQQFCLIPVTSLENPLIDAYGFGAMRDGVLIGHDGFLPPYGSFLSTYKDYDFIILLNGAGKGSKQPVEAAANLLKGIIGDVIDLL